MCDPVTATVATLLTAAGTYEQYRGQQMAKDAMSSAQDAESARQKALRNEADAAFSQSLAKQSVDNQDREISAKTAQREQAMVGNQVAKPVVNIPVQGGAPTIVSDETSARVGQGNLSARQEAAAKAALAAFGDVQLGNALANAHYGQQQAMLANFMNGSQAVLPTELEAARQHGSGTRLLGDILVTSGQLAGMSGGFSGGNAGTSGSASMLGNTSNVVVPSGTSIGAGTGLTASNVGRFSNPFLNGSYGITPVF